MVNLKKTDSVNDWLFWQILSRINFDSTKEGDVSSGVKGKASLIPSFNEFVANRDYSGALTLLEVTQ